MDINIQEVIRAAKAGGEVIQKYFGQVLEIEEKSHVSDFRTKADLEAESAILNIIKQAFPNFNIYSEEAGRIDKKSEYTFIIDPLDGSNNFVLGIPTFTVSIALMKNEEIILGVIYNPVLNQTFYAEKGKGAFVDGKQIGVNSETDIKKATVSYTCGYINSSEYSETITHRLNELSIKRQTNNWSPAHDYCLLASGRMEAIINNQNDLYDFAAGKLLVTEAGGKITGFSGETVKDVADKFVASNGTAIHQQILEIL